MNIHNYSHHSSYLSRLRGINPVVKRILALLQLVRVDPHLVASVVMLCGGGLFVLYSASDGATATVRHQAWIMLAGLIVMLCMAQLEVRLLRSWAVGVYIAGLVLLGLVLLIGVEENGARSWLDLPGLPSFQPSELMKFAVPVLLAWYLAIRPLPPSFKHTFWAVVFTLIPVILIALQNDVGTAFMVAMSGVFVILLAGINWRFVFSGLLALALASPAWYLFLAQPHQKNRILTFFDPYLDPTGAGYNIIQSQIAIGSGGLYGKGYQLGAQSHLDFIPESSTDFIFAVLAEEFGLLGVLCLIALYFFVLVRGFYIALNAEGMFGRLLAGSITLTFFLYVFVNMAMVSGLLPVIGLPLPLVSRGGTSVLTLFIGFGLLMSIQTHTRSNTLTGKRFDGNSLNIR
ncbi:MAG: rod shape-determining protein RodA [Pseudohongiellaceae bacterium]